MQIKHVNLYYLLLNSFHNQVIWNQSDLNPPKIYLILPSGQDVLSYPKEPDATPH